MTTHHHIDADDLPACACLSACAHAQADTHADRLGTLRITKVEKRTSSGGAWVKGRMGGHRFEALVFPEHAESPDFELGDSRISKLWVRSLDDDATVANFDRGWDILPATPRAKTIVDLLAAGLAEHVYAS